MHAITKRDLDANPAHGWLADPSARAILRLDGAVKVATLLRPPLAVAKWRVDPAAVASLADAIGVSLPVTIRSIDGHSDYGRDSYGQHLRYRGRHYIDLAHDMNRALAEKVLRHELAHAAQAEAFPTQATYVDEFLRPYYASYLAAADWEDDAMAHENLYPDIRAIR